MSQSSLVLVTGISGYLGAHVVDQLVRQGYRVRGTVRSAKLSASQEAFKLYGDAIEVIAFDDLVKGSYTDALKSVDSVIHVAAPLIGPRGYSCGSPRGSLNILRQTEEAGIKNFVLTSSIVTYGNLTKDHGRVLTDDDWYGITREEVVNNKDVDGWTVYCAGKALAEKAVWEFAEKHPNIEITAINPSFFYGPFAPGHKAPHEGTAFNPNTISTMGIDVRDVARALVAGLQSPPTAKVGRKRIMLTSERFQPSELVELVVSQRPQLAGRVNEKLKAAPDNLKPVADNSRLKEVLGLEATPWQKTVLDSADAIVQLEEEWKTRGAPI
ncbi:hypothetical protein EIP91_008273 [Steccherinum ochraceum]|uniref:NAD-dependent epimerase/dehydratase domain-containing protein n=1 Tax=Steccherinum ochraceum TaxID=92696 RepID=A0A4R0R8S6_9APHY|nr:hypothetical protein EIP91_008273 [Steccherinum ochraceum]